MAQKMNKYIDADRLKAEIERNTPFHHRVYLKIPLALIDYLQQEQLEVNLETITKYSRIKELPDGFEKEWLCYYHKNPEYNSAKFSHLSLIEREYIIARYFYELGQRRAAEMYDEIEYNRQRAEEESKL